jgi:hypothetical protein
VTVQVLMVVGVPEVEQAIHAGRLALGFAVGDQPGGRRDHFVPACQHLLQQARTAWHRVIQQNVYAPVRIANAIAAV